jgi:hypothetical protein
LLKLKQKYFSHFQWRGAKSFVQKHSQNCYVQWLLTADCCHSIGKWITTKISLKSVSVCVSVFQCATVWLFNHLKSCNFECMKTRGKWERKEKQHKRWKFSNKLFPIDIFSFLWAFVFPLFLLLHFLSLTLFLFYEK